MFCDVTTVISWTSSSSLVVYEGYLSSTGDRQHAVFQIWSYYISRTIWPDYDNCDKFHFISWGACSLWTFATAVGKRLCFMSIISAANKVSCLIISGVLLSKDMLSQFPPLDLKEFPRYHIKRQFQKNIWTMGLLPDAQHCGLRMRRECQQRFSPPPTPKEPKDSPPPTPSQLKETASYRSRHASRHVRDARAVMHVGIACPRWRGKRSRHSWRMRTRNFPYLIRGPWNTSTTGLQDNYKYFTYFVLDNKLFS